MWPAGAIRATVTRSPAANRPGVAGGGSSFGRCRAGAEVRREGRVGGGRDGDRRGQRASMSRGVEGAAGGQSGLDGAAASARSSSPRGTRRRDRLDGRPQLTLRRPLALVAIIRPKTRPSQGVVEDGLVRLGLDGAEAVHAPHVVHRVRAWPTVAL